MLGFRVYPDGRVILDLEKWVLGASGKIALTQPLPQERRRRSEEMKARGAVQCHGLVRKLSGYLQISAKRCSLRLLHVAMTYRQRRETLGNVEGQFRHRRIIHLEIIFGG